MTVFSKEFCVTQKIKLYALSTCIYCQRTKELLNNHNIEYDFTDVDLLDEKERYAILRKIKQLAGGVSFPLLIIDDTIIKGYKHDKIKAVLKL